MIAFLIKFKFKPVKGTIPSSNPSCRSCESLILIDFNFIIDVSSVKEPLSEKIIFEQRTNERINEIKNLINIKKEKIIFYDHHFCHMSSSYYLSSFNKKNKILGITLDGSGDNSSGKIYICQNGKFKKISETSRDASLGKIYSRVTKLLGMKPWEHEYKVMGLAPYANEKYYQKIYFNW